MKKILFMLAALLISTPTHAERSLRVVTTLSTFADLVKTIGGDSVEVSYIASPKFNPHFIEPKPSDVMKIKKADLFVHAGLDLEVWRDPLLSAAGNLKVMPGAEGELDLSKGIRLLEVPAQMPSRAEGDIHIYGNPHYWLSPENGKQMAKTIAEKLSVMDFSHAESYQRNLNDFLRRLDQKTAEWKKQAEAIRGKEAVAYHNEWVYLADFSGIKIAQFLEPKPGIPPTPRHVEFIEQYLREKEIKIIIQTSYFPARTAEAIASNTGASVIFLNQSVGEIDQASDYIAMMEYNIMKLSEALM